MIGALLAALVLVSSGLLLSQGKRRPLWLVLGLVALPLVWSQSAAAGLTLGILLAVLWGLPLFAIYGIAAALCFLLLSETGQLELGIFPEKIRDLADKNELLAIPFFVLAGAIMSEGGIAKRLIDVADALTDWLPGGIGVAAIAACVFFAAISGSSPVTVIAVGGMMYPTMVRHGFGERGSMGLLTSAGSLGIVIPPSIPMILYAIVASAYRPVDVGELFVAGIGPGLLIGGMLCLYVIGRSFFQTPDPNIATEGERPSAPRALAIFTTIVALCGLAGWAGTKALHLPFLAGLCFALLAMAVIKAPRQIAEGAWALALPIIILGGIYSGLFTPTDAAAVAVFYSLAVSIFVYRDLKPRQLPEIVTGSVSMIGALVTVMIVTFVLNEYFNAEQIPDALVTWIEGKDLTTFQFLLALNALLLVVGCFMDIISAILIITPLIIPMAMAPGIDVDPLHLGIIFIVNLELGYLTPPLGLNLFVASSLFKKPLEEVIRSVVPYAVILLAGVMVVTYVPAVSLGLLHRPAAIDASGPAEEPPGVKSLKELMQDTLDGGSGAETKVKSLEEIMRDELGGAGSPEPKRAPEEVKSLEEIMRDTLEDKEE